MAAASFPPRVMSRFAQALSAEVGSGALISILEKSGLPTDWARADFFSTLDAARSARAYAQLQSALRAYYGRGARGALLRIGSKLWEPLLQDGSVSLKARALTIRALPLALRRKSALDLLAHVLGGVSVHTQDLDLLFVDKSSPTTLDQAADEAICFVTLGLLREALFWADGQEHDVEERACRARGAAQCEFKITFGGKP